MLHFHSEIVFTRVQLKIKADNLVRLNVHFSNVFINEMNS